MNAYLIGQLMTGDEVLKDLNRNYSNDVRWSLLVLIGNAQTTDRTGQEISPYTSWTASFKHRISKDPHHIHKSRIIPNEPKETYGVHRTQKCAYCICKSFD